MFGVRRIPNYPVRPITTKRAITIVAQPFDKNCVSVMTKQCTIGCKRRDFVAAVHVVFSRTMRTLLLMAIPPPPIVVILY